MSIAAIPLRPGAFLLPGRSARRRLGPLAIVLLLHALLLGLLVLINPKGEPGRRGPTSMIAFNVPSPPVARPQPASKPKPAIVPPLPSAAPPVPDVVIPNAPAPRWTIGDPALTGFDLARTPRAEPAPAEYAVAAGPPDTQPIGTAPDGSPLYPAEWQREPTQAELAFYIKDRGRPGAWGVIVCRTAARFKVEDCRPVAESPGSGMAYAVGEAAWQFRVKPPRIKGEFQTGTWVQIRIDITPADR